MTAPNFRKDSTRVPVDHPSHPHTPTAADSALAETFRTAAHALEKPGFSQGDLDAQMGIVRAKADSAIHKKKKTGGY